MRGLGPRHIRPSAAGGKRAALYAKRRAVVCNKERAEVTMGDEAGLPSGGDRGAVAHVLVIDDDRKITAALRRGLAYQGYRVDVAHDGTEGLELARRWAPDIVILDILMPGIDGLEVCRRLRAGGDVRVLLLTARDSIEDRVVGLVPFDGNHSAGTGR